MQVWLIHMKILPGQVYNRPINLYPIDGNWSVDCTKFTRNRSCSQTNHAHSLYLRRRKGWSIKIGGYQKIVPRPLRQNLLRVIDRMDTHTLIQHQLYLISRAHYLNVVIRRLALRNQYATISTTCWLDRPRWAKHRQSQGNEQQQRKQTFIQPKTPLRWWQIVKAGRD